MMKQSKFVPIFLVLAWFIIVNCAPAVSAEPASGNAAKPLASWADNKTRQKIVDFVEAITQPGNKDFIPPEGRIAVFDNDGTLIPEIPLPFMLEYAYQRFQTALSEDREGKADNDMILAELEKNGIESAMALNARRVLEILVAAYAGDDPEMLGKDVAAWLDQPFPGSAESERRRRDAVYKPMLELLNYLSANQFKIYLVTGSEQEFARALAKELYNLPPDRVIGSEQRYRFEEKNGQMAVSLEPRLSNMNVGAVKALNISSRIGRAPVFAAGNSDGDLEMLKLTTQTPGRRLGLIVHHTDAEREFAYDREAGLGGKLRKGLDQAKANGWLLVDMRDDWKEIYIPLSGIEETEEQSLAAEPDNAAAVPANATAQDSTDSTDSIDAADAADIQAVPAILEDEPGSAQP